MAFRDNFSSYVNFSCKYYINDLLLRDKSFIPAWIAIVVFSAIALDVSVTDYKLTLASNSDALIVCNLLLHDADLCRAVFIDSKFADSVVGLCPDVCSLGVRAILSE